MYGGTPGMARVCPLAKEFAPGVALGRPGLFLGVEAPDRPDKLVIALHLILDTLFHAQERVAGNRV